MKIMLLSPCPERVAEIFRNDILITQSHNGPIPECDFVVSYGHQHILKGEVLETYKDRIINVHWGLLPWNRGASPNFWSWYDNSPKGVTIHHLDKGIDTGDIILQAKVKFRYPERETLETSYDRLQHHSGWLLGQVWADIRAKKPLRRVKQEPGGSTHWIKDMASIKLPAGWKTPVQYVRDLGERERGGEHGQKTGRPGD
jgi:methionyl-tRNA formyltransferase